MDALFTLFGARPPVASEPPTAVMKNLAFLRGDSGSGGTARPPRKPEVEIRDCEVVDGRWFVTFEVKAKNRPEGWSMRPALALVGLDGTRQVVAWESMECQTYAAVIDDGTLHIPEADRGRFVKILVSGASSATLPVPAEEVGIDVLLRDAGPLVTSGVLR